MVRLKNRFHKICWITFLSLKYIINFGRIKIAFVLQSMDAIYYKGKSNSLQHILVVSMPKNYSDNLKKTCKIKNAFLLLMDRN